PGSLLASGAVVRAGGGVVEARRAKEVRSVAGPGRTRGGAAGRVDDVLARLGLFEQAAQLGRLEVVPAGDGLDEFLQLVRLAEARLGEGRRSTNEQAGGDSGKQQRSHVDLKWTGWHREARAPGSRCSAGPDLTVRWY